MREIHRRLRAEGVEVGGEVDASAEGPASCFVVDPDGNRILIDRHT